jgi:colanic acid/amylovoran biosynthesis protein
MKEKSGLRCLLLGNGPYVNRGCEAIVRGTMQILRRAFPEPIAAINACYAPEKMVQRQAAQETDPGVGHVALKANRFSTPWLLEQMNRRLGLHTPGRHWPLVRPMRGCAVALEVGGDNYSLDYGLPLGFLEMDRFVLSAGIPVVIWGASVGPFDRQPAFARQMHDHLRRLTAIFVRESESLEYLHGHGIRDNVHEVADPAFAMEPEMPPDGVLPELPLAETIGMNVSGRMAKYVTGGDLERWLEICADAVAAIARNTGRRVLLIPHVMNPEWWDNDHTVCTMVSERVRARAGLEAPVLPPLPAAQLKWVIARCEAFLGARTHSTIAALSSCVPTVSLAYSVKARGINRDVLGTLDYCIEPQEMTAEVISGRVGRLLAEAGKLRAHLRATMPPMVERAYRAGSILNDLLVERAGYEAESMAEHKAV